MPETSRRMINPTQQGRCRVLKQRFQSLIDQRTQTVSVILFNPRTNCQIQLQIPIMFSVRQLTELLVEVDQERVLLGRETAQKSLALLVVGTYQWLDSGQSLAIAGIRDNDAIQIEWRERPRSRAVSQSARRDRALGNKSVYSVIAIGLSIIIAAVLGILVGLMIARTSTGRQAIMLATPVDTESVELVPTASSEITTPIALASPDIPAVLPTAIPSSSPDAPLSPNNTYTLVLPTSTAIPLGPTAAPLPFSEGPFVIGSSADGRTLYAYRLGNGMSVRAIIGGIHGGYEPNTTVFVSKTLEYLLEHPEQVPISVTLYVVPLANPDGFVEARGTLDGRMNANGVDLNRNWDYQWQMTATHGYRPVSAGARPFSEPETAALRDLILDKGVEAAIVYHSGLSCIFSAADTINSATIELADIMSAATGYPHRREGVPGQITTGDAIDWMSTQGITAIEVELTDHDDPEWERNLLGVFEFLNWGLDKPDAEPLVWDIELGLSMERRAIKGAKVGDGKQTAIVVIGAIHGDEKNTYALVQMLAEHYRAKPALVPDSHVLYFIPTMNPDGLATGTRTNANGVDLNRNWNTDDWIQDAVDTSGIELGSGGTSPASEPEVQNVAWQLLVIKEKVEKVIILFYHSAHPPTGFVQPGYSDNGVPAGAADSLAQLVADVSGYQYGVTRDSKAAPTGEAIHWCSDNDIASIYIELPNQNEPTNVPEGFAESTLDANVQMLEALIQHTLDASQ
jgi:predicted deacylase